MWRRVELQALVRWCQMHCIRWMPAADPAGRPAVLLEGNHRRRGWKRMMLILDDEGFRLSTDSGEPVVAASELRAVLDTLCDGVPRPAAAAQPLRSFRRHATERGCGFVV